MATPDDANLPDELREVEERLRAARPSFTELELDQLKLRTIAQGSHGPRTGAGRLKGMPMRSRLAMLAVAVLLIGGTTGGAIAAGGAGGSSNAASDQYKPGKGCGNPGLHSGPPGMNVGNNECPPTAGQP